MARALRPKVKAFDPKVFLEKVGAGRTALHYGKNRTIFLQGTPADAVFYVQRGKLKVTVLSKEGKEAVIGILGAHGFFGEGVQAGQQVRMSSASTITECSIMRFEKEGLEAVLHNEPIFS